MRKSSLTGGICHPQEEFVIHRRNLSLTGGICHPQEEFVIHRRNLSLTGEICHPQEEFVIHRRNLSFLRGICHFQEEFDSYRANPKSTIETFRVNEWLGFGNKKAPKEEAFGAEKRFMPVLATWLCDGKNAHSCHRKWFGHREHSIWRLPWCNCKKPILTYKYRCQLKSWYRQSCQWLA